MTRDPIQQRSRKTMERILAATERLLRDRPFERIAVADIVRRAHASIGAFYARFEDKEALLPHLYARYDESLHRRFESMIRRYSRARPSRALLIDRLVRDMMSRYRARRWFFRAMALYARQRGDPLGAERRRRRTEMHQALAQALAAALGTPGRLCSPRQVEIGLFTVAAACRDRILFADTPPASSLSVSDEELRRELSAMLLAYLSG